MSLLKSIPRAELLRDYVYFGWMFGVVPVYVGRLNGPEGPAVSVRNWCPEWVFDLAAAVFDAMVAPFLAEPSFPIVITRRLDGAPLGELE